MMKITSFVHTHFKTYFSIAVCTLLASCSDNTPHLSDDWPARQIDIVVYSSAGGSTDLTNRALAQAMKTSFDQNISVLNMPGALGGTAVNYVWNQPHDGHRLAGISEGALAHAALGLIHTTAKDWEWFMVGGTPGVISVAQNSPYLDFSDLLDAIKTSPDTLTIATSVPGSIWHIQWINTTALGGFNTRFIPFAGSQPSQVAAMTGEVDIVWTGLGEQAELIKGKRLRPLAVFNNKPVNIQEHIIPAITDYFPTLKDVMPIDQFVGFAVPADTPESTKKKLDAAFVNAMRSDAVKDFATSKFVTLRGLSGQAAKDVALAQQWKMFDALNRAGLAKKTAAELGVSKP